MARRRQSGNQKRSPGFPMKLPSPVVSAPPVAAPAAAPAAVPTKSRKEGSRSVTIRVAIHEPGELRLIGLLDPEQRRMALLTAVGRELAESSEYFEELAKRL